MKHDKEITFLNEDRQPEINCFQHCPFILSRHHGKFLGLRSRCITPMKWQILTTFTMALQIPEAALSEYWPCAIILSKSSSRSTKFHHKVHRVPILISTPKFHDMWLTRHVAKSEPLSSYHPYHSWTQAYVAEWICRHKFDQLSSQCINMWCPIDLNPILFQQITRLKNILCDAVLFFFLFQDLNISYFFLSFIILAYRIVLHLFIWVNWSVLYMLEHLVLLKMYWFIEWL